MEVFLLVLLGIVQGVTEFIPVSSSGHLVLFQHIAGLEYPGITLEVAVHGGTLVAVLAYYGRDALGVLVGFLAGLRDLLWKKRPSRDVFMARDFHLGLTLFCATLVTSVLAYLLRDVVVGTFTRLPVIAAAWIFTGALLWSARGRNPEGTLMPVGFALLMGLAQALAILPGVSRSGITIVAALFLGLSRREAARFSFLLSIPVIGGALLMDFPQARALLEAGAGPGMIAGVIAAAASGYVALRLVIGKVVKGELHHFSPYLWVLGGSVLIVTVGLAPG